MQGMRVSAVSELVHTLQRCMLIASLRAESDEEDFQGPGDSHLTRVMKEYVASPANALCNVD